MNKPHENPGCLCKPCLDWLDGELRRLAGAGESRVLDHDQVVYARKDEELLPESLTRGIRALVRGGGRL